MTEKEFNSSIMAPIQFSLATSKIAVDKAINENVKEFAGFELAEANSFTKVLKDMDTLIPELDEAAKIAFTEIESNSGEVDFDQLYILSQLKNHRLLRDLTEDYLNEAPNKNLDTNETQCKHLATMALILFNEHVAITERISEELKNGAAANLENLKSRF